MTDTSSTHYTGYNTIRSTTQAAMLRDAIPGDNDQHKTHASLVSQEKSLCEPLKKLRAENPKNYYGEICSKILVPRPIGSDYISAAL